MEKIIITTEYSAQPYAQKPNPMVEKSLIYLADIEGLLEESKICDQGCGALRHLKVLMKYYNDIYMVDTEFQINRSRIIEGNTTTIKEYINDLNVPNKKIKLILNKEFLISDLGLDAVFNLCTFDVVLPEIRKEMLEAARKNIRRGGYFVLIIPRNDSSILCRCKKENIYADGHYFKNRGACTYYSNFRDQKVIIDMALEYNFNLVKDMSIFRHICLIFTTK